MNPQLVKRLTEIFSDAEDIKFNDTINTIEDYTVYIYKNAVSYGIGNISIDPKYPTEDDAFAKFMTFKKGFTRTKSLKGFPLITFQNGAEVYIIKYRLWFRYHNNIYYISRDDDGLNKIMQLP